MTEFQELVKDAPKFASMERGELVAYAYAMYAAGAKMDAENAKLRKDIDRFVQAIEDLHDVSLEDKLVQLENENAKLRNEVDNLLDFEHLTSVAVAYAGCDECGEYKQTMLCLFAENAKLRELAYRMLGSIRRFEACSDSYSVSSVYEQWMCELGIEVDDGTE